MPEKDIETRAGEHWDFIEVILTLAWGDSCDNILIPIDACKYLYIQAMIHGYKHRLDEEENQQVKRDS